MLEKIPSAVDPPPAPQLLLHIPVRDLQSSKKVPQQHASPVDIYNVVRDRYQKNGPSAIGAAVIPQVPEQFNHMTLENLEEKVMYWGTHVLGNYWPTWPYGFLVIFHAQI